MNIQWKSASNGQIPEGAIIVGHEANGMPLFLCRAKKGKGLIPGKIRPRFKAANIGLGGLEIKIADYEVYCGGGKWVEAADGKLPNGAVVVGNEFNGIPLYAARAEFNMGLHPGKIRHGVPAALIPFGHEEHEIPKYEVLVIE